MCTKLYIVSLMLWCIGSFQKFNWWYGMSYVKALFICKVSVCHVTVVRNEQLIQRTWVMLSCWQLFKKNISVIKN